MTQEEKNLVIKDLCARLPYGVIVDNPNPSSGVWDEVINIDISTKTVTLLYNGRVFSIDYVRPYLRPMSSMTEEEYNSMSWEGCNHIINYSVKHGFQFVEITSFTIEILNWLNANHFDYCGLIEKGLALEAPEGMYKTE